jgi:HJR/Mrr/RecB family endonuclease
MFIVGIEQKSRRWRYISNGVTAYITDGDFRTPASCKPPPLKIWDEFDEAHALYKPAYKNFGNQIGQADLFQDLSLISIHHLNKVHAASSTSEAASRLANENNLDLFFGTGSQNANPNLNGLFKKISAWSLGLDQIEVSKTYYELHQLATNLLVAWLSFDKNVELIRAASEARERKIWDRYWRLRDLASLDDLPGIEFERAIEGMYKKLGYETSLTKKSGDFGVDLIVVKGSHRYAIQVKRNSGNVGISAVQQVVAGGKLYQATKYVVVTNSLFTQAAKELARAHSVELVDRNKLGNIWKVAFPISASPSYSAEEFRKIRPEILGALADANATKPKLSKRSRATQNRRW